jgi:hypothetical protein
MNVESAVGLPATWSRGDFLDRCRHLVLSEQMSRHGRVRGRGCRKSRTGYAQRASIGQRRRRRLQVKVSNYPLVLSPFSPGSGSVPAPGVLLSSVSSGLAWGPAAGVFAECGARSLSSGWSSPRASRTMPWSLLWSIRDKSPINALFLNARVRPPRAVSLAPPHQSGKFHHRNFWWNRRHQQLQVRMC